MSLTLDEAATYLGIDVDDLRADLAQGHQRRDPCDDPTCRRPAGDGHRPGCAHWTPPHIWARPPILTHLPDDGPGPP